MGLQLATADKVTKFLNRMPVFWIFNGFFQKMQII